MKKLVCVLIAFVLALVLCACSDIGGSVEDLLAAPQLSVEQGDIMDALAEGRQGALTLKYPSSGSRRTPIQFIDLDRDGEDEALVSFVEQGAVAYAQLAVLDKGEGKWSVFSEIDGDGTEVYAIGLLEYENAVFILAEWTAVGRTSREFAVYEYVDGVLQERYSHNCVQLITTDMDMDGSDEIVFAYLSPEHNRYMLSCAEYVDGGFTSAGTIALNRSTVACAGLTAGKLSNGTHAVFVDANIGSRTMHTEVFSFNANGYLSGTDYQGGNIDDLTRRETGLIGTRKLSDGCIYIPSQLSPTGAKTFDRWLYFYTIKRGSAEAAYLMWVNQTYRIGVCAPLESLGTLEIVQSAAEQRRFLVLELDTKPAEGEDDTRKPIAELKVLLSNERGTIYLNEGFIRVGATERYSYYIKLGDESLNAQYIFNNIMILD